MSSPPWSSPASASRTTRTRRLATEAIEATGFVVSLENHHSAVTALADVVLPVAVVTEKAGTFLDWEGRPRPFGQVFRDALTMSDARVLAMIAEAMGLPAPADVTAIRSELGRLGPWTGARAAAPARSTGRGTATVSCSPRGASCSTPA